MLIKVFLMSFDVTWCRCELVAQRSNTVVHLEGQMPPSTGPKLRIFPTVVSLLFLPLQTIEWSIHSPEKKKHFETLLSYYKMFERHMLSQSHSLAFWPKTRVVNLS